MNNNSFKLLAFAPFAIFAFACNNESKTSEKTEMDTMTKETPVVRDLPAFDKSRSVTVISPDHYKQLADTLNIRMVSGIYKPGDSSIMHAHPDFAMYILEGGTVELTAQDGSKQNIEFKKDMAVIMPATTHSAKNIGKTTLKIIVVEVNRPRN